MVGNSVNYKNKSLLAPNERKILHHYFYLYNLFNRIVDFDLLNNLSLVKNELDEIIEEILKSPRKKLIFANDFSRWNIDARRMINNRRVIFGFLDDKFSNSCLSYDEIEWVFNLSDSCCSYVWVKMMQITEPEFDSAPDGSPLSCIRIPVYKRLKLRPFIGAGSQKKLEIIKLIDFWDESLCNKINYMNQLEIDCARFNISLEIRGWIKNNKQMIEWASEYVLNNYCDSTHPDWLFSLDGETEQINFLLIFFGLQSTEDEKEMMGKLKKVVPSKNTGFHPIEKTIATQ
ncbi:hypothetical protein [uncultured Tolumonas sp.]|uniref:hypothetical protein n=1 Tax=uncultured Tolumonas sp. TaxID=263765 RepID=UPI00292D9050|nr:hypothetical protein [uncultured Tolumonas sp.]